MSIQAKTMLVKLTVHKWSGFKRDKNVTEHVDDMYKTDGEAGNYNKRLFSKIYLKKVNNLASRIRSEHERLTTPFLFEGMNVLPKALYFSYCQTMRELNELYDKAVHELIDYYEVEIGLRRAALQEMFRMEDYPTKDELKQKFSISFDFFPMPSAGHYILDLEQEEQEKLQSRLNEQLKEMHTSGLVCIYKRVLDIVEHVHERLDDPANIFHASMLDHVRDISEALPGLNYYGDETLYKVADEIKTKLLMYDVIELRENMQKRSEIARNAYAISLILKENIP